MKARAFVLFSILGVFGILGQAMAQPYHVTAAPTSVFTPKGFDSNDNAQLVVSGVLTSLCQKLGPTTFKVDRAEKKIIVEQQIFMTNKVCAAMEMYIPYTSVVNLGRLEPGAYEVSALDYKKHATPMAVLPIKRANSNPNTSGTDDVLYAQVTSIDLKMKTDSGYPQLTLKGYLTSSCVSFAKIDLHRREGNVIEVLPTLAVSRGGCLESIRPFSKTISLGNIPATDTLIHVRSMGGQSLNRVITKLDRLGI